MIAGLLALLLITALAVALAQPTKVAALNLPEPVVALDVPAQSFVGTAVNFTATFDNAATNLADAGYGPYIDLFLPKSGIDGLSTVGGPAVNDGITFNSATYLGNPVAGVLLDCPAAGTATHPLTGLTVTCPAAPGNYTGPAPYIWQLVVLELPFGSFVPDQPPAAISVSASMSNLADLGKPLPIQGFGRLPLRRRSPGQPQH